MHRHRFLAHALRLSAAVAALPLVGGLAAVTADAGPEIADLSPAVISEPVVQGNIITNSVGAIELPPGYWVISDTGQTTFSIVGNTIR